MEFTKEDGEAYNKILVEHYGHPDSWKTDHWKHFNVLGDIVAKEGIYKRDWIEAERMNNNLNVNVRIGKYDKEIQSLQFEANKLTVLADKVEQVEGLEPNEKFVIAKYLRDDCQKLIQEGISLVDECKNLVGEYVNLRQDELDNPPTYKKSVGRPNAKSKLRYQWMDYLVSELGTYAKAVDYASDFPMFEHRPSGTIKREYRKYRND